MNQTLLKEMSSDLNIPKDKTESDAEWERRVLYSVLGLQMLTSLYDYEDSGYREPDRDETDKTVSMQHVLSRGKKLSELYELNLNDNEIESIRELFIYTGYMLHKANRLIYPPTKIARYSGVLFYRGLPPWKAINVSGMGLYEIGKNSDSIRLSEMFSFCDTDNSTWFETFIKSVNWSNINSLPDDVEFLNISKQATSGYWLSTPPNNGITLCRTKVDHKRYTLLKFGETLESFDLPEWLVRVTNDDNSIRKYAQQEYFRIANALRIKNGLIPKAEFSASDFITKIKFDYLLPPAEQNFVGSSRK
jgi:hypothetical protein